ncbi:uncharacterized protein METZ01_LOCUS321654, partial [marine metagenome]
MTQPVHYRRTLQIAVICLCAGILAVPAFAQDYGARLGTVKRGGDVKFEPTGPGVLFDA